MNDENKQWTKGTDVTEQDLKCGCGKERIIVHVSNHHNESGIFWAECSCGKATNVPWKRNV